MSWFRKDGGNVQARIVSINDPRNTDIPLPPIASCEHQSGGTPDDHSENATGDEREHNPYRYSDNERTNIEKAIRSVSFLLEWCSDIGNEEVEGNIANGLSYVLDRVADKTNELYSAKDVIRLGGDPYRGRGDS